MWRRRAESAPSPGHMARENQRQASQLQSLSSGGHERTVGIADEAQQRKLRAAIEATAAAEAAAAAQRADRFVCGQWVGSKRPRCAAIDEGGPRRRCRELRPARIVHAGRRSCAPSSSRRRTSTLWPLRLTSRGQRRTSSCDYTPATLRRQCGHSSGSSVRSDECRNRLLELSDAFQAASQMYLLSRPALGRPMDLRGEIAPAGSGRLRAAR